jgi:hypothetical protein
VTGPPLRAIQPKVLTGQSVHCLAEQGEPCVTAVFLDQARSHTDLSRGQQARHLVLQVWRPVMRNLSRKVSEPVYRVAPEAAMCYHRLVENRVASLVIDATDAELLARFWAAALGWQLINRGGYGVSIGIDGGPFEIDFRYVPDGPKAAKNRLHLDIKPISRDQAAELDRLLALGARQVDVGQGTRSWHVLADPEGNEFCLCRP